MNIHKIFDFIGQKFPKYQIRDLSPELYQIYNRVFVNNITKNPFDGYTDEDNNIINLDDILINKNYTLKEYENGFLKKIWNTKGLVKNGRYTTYLNGKIMEDGYYNMDKKDKEWKKYNNQDFPEIIVNFRNGIKNGLFIWRHENGKLKLNGYYEDGYKHGRFEYHRQDGKLVKIEQWNHGTKTNEEHIG